MVHLEILVEDASGAVLVEGLLARMFTVDECSRRIFPYKGIGAIPKRLKPKANANARILLDQMPRLLAGYGKSLDRSNDAVVVLVDADDKDCREFLRELKALEARCKPAPRVLFRLAIEEAEAWLLSDREAVLKAYPQARRSVLDSYKPDSVGQTWEQLAEAVHPGGAARLKAAGYRPAGAAKEEWARKIGPHLNIASAKSPSLRKFVDGVRRLVDSLS